MHPNNNEQVFDSTVRELLKIGGIDYLGQPPESLLQAVVHGEASEVSALNLIVQAHVAHLLIDVWAPFEKDEWTDHLDAIKSHLRQGLESCHDLLLALPPLDGHYGDDMSLAIVSRTLAGLPATQLHVVRDQSMVPGVRPGDWLVVSRAPYRRTAPERAEIVSLRDPEGSRKTYLKRVVGLPGEDLEIEDGLLFVDGRRLQESYLEGLPASLGLDASAWMLGRRQVFVMGDNRVRSRDSRHFGPVDLDLIVGRAWFRCWPWRSWGPLSAGEKEA